MPESPPTARAENEATQRFYDRVASVYDLVYGLTLQAGRRTAMARLAPAPVAVAREMHRVCRPGGRIVLLNHFASANRAGAPRTTWVDWWPPRPT